MANLEIEIMDRMNMTVSSRYIADQQLSKMYRFLVF